MSYGALLGDKPFNVKFTGTAPQKPINRYKLVGARVPRVDIPDKVAANTSTCSRCACPACCTAAWCGRAASAPMATAPSRWPSTRARLHGHPGARVVRKGDFVGVVAEREWDAIKAARALKVTWQESTALPGHADVFERMRAAKTTDTVIADWGDAEKGFARPRMWRRRPIAARTSRTRRSRPNCALADVGPGGALVMSSTQDIYNSRDMLARGARPAGQQGARAICTRAPAPSAAAATRTPRRPPR